MRLYGKIIHERQLAYCTCMHMHLVHYEIFDVKLSNIYVCAIKVFYKQLMQYCFDL